MKTFKQALEEFTKDEDGFAYVFKFGDNDEYELVFEKLMFDSQYYVALYKNKNILINKVVVKPGKYYE